MQNEASVNRYILDIAAAFIFPTAFPEQKHIFSAPDWKHFLQICENNFISSLVHAAVTGAGKQEIFPEPVLAELKKRRVRSAAKSCFFREEYEKLSAKGEERSLTVRPLKGLSYQYTIYRDNPETREMEDFDLYIKPSGLPELEKLLLENGYAALNNYPKDYYRKYLNSKSYLHKGTGLLLEAHYYLINTKITVPPHLIKLNYDEMAGPSGAPDAYDEIMINTEHLLRHSFRRLNWYLDIMLLLRQAADFAELEKRARKYNLSIPFNYIAGTLKKSFCPHYDHLSADAREGASLAPSLGKKGPSFYLYLKMNRNPGELVRFFLFYLKTGREALSIMYPARNGNLLALLYYRVRSALRNILRLS